MPQPELYFEDFTPGLRFDSLQSPTITAQEIQEFGEKYDPQPLHLDVGAGSSSFFKGLAASGWLTAAIVMRLRVDTIRVAGGMIGIGVDEIRWTAPVRPGDALRTQIIVVSTRPSQKYPEFGIVKITTTAYNQRDEVVLRSTVSFLAPKKK
jgi:acyl dehydratase